MTDKKIAPQTQGNQNQSTEYSTTAKAQVKKTEPRTQAECERALSPKQSIALRLTRLPEGMNDMEAAEKHGLTNFIQRKCETQNLGFVFDEQSETYTDMQGDEHPRMLRFRFLEWRADMIGCKDKDRAQEAIDQGNQLNLFDLESA